MTESQFITKILHKPWVNRASSFDAVDCWGLVLLYYKHVVGVELPLVGGYESNECTVETGFIEQASNWIEHNSPLHGCVVVFYSGDHPAHVGIMIDGNKVLHARGNLNQSGKVEIHSLRSLKTQYSKVSYHTYGDR